MKKLFLSFVVAMIAATATFAQNTLVATLSHGEDVSMYYGVHALRNAVNAAVSGDVINLSGGAFNAVDITKAITLRGTGIDDPLPTYIGGNFTINIPTSDENRIMMEGIRCTGTIYMHGTFSSAYFLKCKFYSFYYFDNSAITTTVFADCKIGGGDYFNLNGNSSVQFINSYVSGFVNKGETTATASFLNCVIRVDRDNSSYSYAENFKSSQLLNCIVCFPGYTTSFPSSAVILNCLSVNYNDAFRYSQINRDCKYASFADVFKDFTGNYSDSQTFELTDEAKAAFLGDDGTQLGMYGGVMPYNSTPSYPQITTMNVANKATADGKLSVEIEVSATE